VEARRCIVCIPRVFGCGFALYLVWKMFYRCGGLKLLFKDEGFQFSNQLCIFLNTLKRRKHQMGKAVADINTTAHT